MMIQLKKIFCFSIYKGKFPDQKQYCVFCRRQRICFSAKGTYEIISNFIHALIQILKDIQEHSPGGVKNSSKFSNFYRVVGLRWLLPYTQVTTFTDQRCEF